MTSKSTIISTIVTTIWGFMGGYLLWGILAAPYLKAHAGTAVGVSKEMPDFPFLLIGCLISGLIFSLIYSKWARGNHSVSQGAQLGLLIGAFIGFGSGIISFATMNILDFSGTLLNGAIYMIHFMIMGILASFVYKKFN